MKDLKIEKLKEEILGREYELSFAFVDKKRIKELNKKYRKKDEPTDILSFPLDKKNGEILICKEMVELKSKKNGMTKKKYLMLLKIHGLLHLKGFKHGSKMSKMEERYLNMFFK